MQSIGQFSRFERKTSQLALKNRDSSALLTPAGEILAGGNKCSERDNPVSFLVFFFFYLKCTFAFSLFFQVLILKLLRDDTVFVT